MLWGPNIRLAHFNPALPPLAAEFEALRAVPAKHRKPQRKESSGTQSTTVKINRAAPLACFAPGGDNPLAQEYRLFPV
jgi:hypothetical protein